ncbi:MAG: I78 family peptidase inhibitor [Pseudorhodobacter sp.]
MMQHAFSKTALLGALLILAACGPASEPEIYNPTGALPVAGGILQGREPDSCGVVGSMRLMGQPGDAAQRAGISRPMRVIPLGGMMIQDYNPERINFYLDANGLIGRISCG